MNEQQERQSEHHVTFSDFEEFSAGKPGNDSIKAEENRYRRIIAAELAVIVVLVVTAGALLIALRRISDWKEPEIMPVIESVAESVPEAEESSVEGESEESEVWYYADYATETENDKYLARNDIKILPSGSILREDQVDRGTPDQYFFAENVIKDDTVYSRIAGKFFREEEPLPELSYLKLLHYNADGDIQVGEMLVLREDAENTLAIFRELFEAECRIPKMRLPEEYWTEDAAHTVEKSDEDRNTAAFSETGNGEGPAAEIRLCLAEEEGPGEEICRIFREHGYSPEKEPGGGKAVFVKDRQQE